VKLYAESSAILAWLLGEPAGPAVSECLDAADRILASDLTLIECDRVLIRAVATGAIPEAEGLNLQGNLARAARRWHTLRLGQDVVERARRSFPVEPVRTLDALHLSLALIAGAALPDLEVLTLDHRVRENARALGLAVAPETV